MNAQWGAAFQQRILNSNNPSVVMQVAPPHTGYGQTVPGSTILHDNPDMIYRFMGVNAAEGRASTPGTCRSCSCRSPARGSSRRGRRGTLPAAGVNRRVTTHDLLAPVRPGATV